VDGHGDAGHDGLLPALNLRMLGPLEAWRGGQQLSLGGQRQRSVLACLLLELGHAVSSDRIVDTVWGAHPPGRVRGTASGVIATVPGGYRLEAARVVIDALRFEELVAAGRASLAGDPAAAAVLFKEALGLWRGEVLGDLTSMKGVVAPVAARLEESRAAATELWVEAEMALGHHDVLGALDDLVARYPLREHLAAMRMLALYRAGGQADALAAYRKLRHTLDDELGIQPSAEVETLHQRVLQQNPSLDLVAPPSKAEPPGQLRPKPRGVPPEVIEGPRRRLLSGLSRRGWAALTAIVVVAVAALVGSTFLARRGGVTPLPPNSVGPVDSGGLIGDAVVLESPPSALASAGRAIWAVLENGNAVVKIDPEFRRVVQTVRGVGGSPQAIAASGDDLWVAGFDEKVLTRINAPTGIVSKTIPVGIEPAAVVAGPYGVWVANSGDNTVQHVDPATEKADPPITVGDGPDALAVLDSTLWVANGRAGTLTPLDSRTGQRVGADIKVDAGPVALAVTSTDVWVANEFGQSVSRVTPSNGRVQRIDVDDGPSSLVVLDDEVWVSNQYSGTMSRIDIAPTQPRPRR
jgi:DNA-binding SARP family transcriptional activator/streptogramin lyase